MIEISSWLWESLYILKNIYDHDPDADILKMYSDNELDGDDMYEIAINSMDQVFSDTRSYYNEEREIDITVFSDPVMTECWQACAEYETKAGIEPKQNEYRQELIRDLQSDLHIPDYSYSGIYYSDLDRGYPRIVMLIGIDFGLHYEIPEALCNAYSSFEYHTKRIKKAIAELEKPKIIELSKKQQRKKAA